MIKIEIIKEMKIPCSYLFSVFTKSIQEDIIKQTGNSVEIKNLEGYEYIKKVSKDSQTLIKIKKFEENKMYHYTTQTDKNKIFVKYDVIPIDENNCKLTYTEKIESYGHLQKLNDILVGFIWSYLKKKKFYMMLSEIEEYYKSNISTNS